MKAIFLLCCVLIYLERNAVSDAIPLDTREKCYDWYGCFPTKYPYSLTRLNKALAPWSPDELQVNLILSTRNSPKHIITNMLPQDVPIPYLDLDKPIKIIAPGFLHGAGNILWTKTLRKVLLRKEDCNVMVLEWKQPIIRLQYAQAVANTRMLGAVVGEFLSHLKVFHNYNLDMVHIYGHSLGAHVAGYIGQYCNNKFGEKIIGTITGLDPAGPQFEGKHPLARLDNEDANFVLALHTNAGFLINRNLGIIQDVGSVDIFVNSGKRQPGCAIFDPTSLKVEDRSLVPEFIDVMGSVVGCSHNRAPEYAIDWLNGTDCNWVAHWCTTWRSFRNGMCKDHGTNNSLTITFGLDYYKETKPKEGRYYIETNSKVPFCIPHGMHHLSRKAPYDNLSRARFF